MEATSSSKGVGMPRAKTRERMFLMRTTSADDRPSSTKLLSGLTSSFLMVGKTKGVKLIKYCCRISVKLATVKPGCAICSCSLLVSTPNSGGTSLRSNSASAADDVEKEAEAIEGGAELELTAALLSLPPLWLLLARGDMRGDMRGDREGEAGEEKEEAEAEELKENEAGSEEVSVGAEVELVTPPAAW